MSKTEGRWGSETTGQQQLQVEEGVRLCERNNSEDFKVSVEEGAENVPGTRVDVPLQPVVKTMVRQLHPSSTWGPQWSRDHLQSMEDPVLDQRHKETPQEAQGGVSLQAGFVTPWGTHDGAIHEELQPEGRLKKFMKDHPSHAGEGKNSEFLL